MYYWIVHSITVISALPIQRCSPRMSYSEPAHSSLWLVTHRGKPISWQMCCDSNGIWMNLTISYLFLWCISWDYSVPVTPLKIPSPRSQQVQTTGAHPSWPWINSLLFYIVEMKCILHRTPLTFKFGQQYTEGQCWDFCTPPIVLASLQYVGHSVFCVALFSPPSLVIEKQWHHSAVQPCWHSVAAPPFDFDWTALSFVPWRWPSSVCGLPARRERWFPLFSKHN